jgi:hypothetical protein
MNKNSQFIYFISRICQYLFEVSFISFIIFFILEYFKEGLVTNYFNFNLFLIFTLIFGIITILLPHFETEGKRKKQRFLAEIEGVLIGVFVNKILPDTLGVYQAVPWIVGIAVWAGLRVINTNTR